MTCVLVEACLLLLGETGKQKKIGELVMQTIISCEGSSVSSGRRDARVSS